MTGSGERRTWRHPMIKSPDQLTRGERAAEAVAIIKEIRQLTGEIHGATTRDK